MIIVTDASLPLLGAEDSSIGARVLINYELPIEKGDTILEDDTSLFRGLADRLWFLGERLDYGTPIGVE
ncbi:hypothetical protein ACH5RR_014068 [Cinchona calisaya]|uniref:Uncharacterized protein n=1 Tax=Cinchona calisaya TaxID=153742 RepID=A0ABD3A1T6_9GENT